jgi:uncharacterized membrane protein
MRSVTSHAPVRPRDWAPPTTLLLSVAGLAVSIYLVIAHYAASDLLVCAENSVVDCHSVTSSEQSELFGVPVAVLGAAFFAFLVLLTTPWAWRSTHPAVNGLRLGSTAVGVLFVVYLVAAEFVLIGKICLWCTAVHVIMLALAAVLLVVALRRPEAE